jgi:hypothetical protein
MSYKRSQLYKGVWGSITQRPNRDGEFPPALGRRIDRLLDLGVGVPANNVKSGIDRIYTLTDAVEIALALSLMTLAWSQSDVVPFIEKNRTLLRNRIEAIDATSNNRVLLWVFPQPVISPILADAQTFRPGLIGYVPRFSTNAQEEMEQLRIFDFGWRERAVIDIGQLKRSLAENLAITPVIRRGVQPKAKRYEHAS